MPKRNQSGPGRTTPTGSQLVYKALRHAIIALELKPGTVLEELQLCRQYGVSRTPVREALIALASEGLIDLQPNRGARVSTLNFADTVDHYEAMDIFLPVTCQMAAARRTAADIAQMRELFDQFCRAVQHRDPDGIVRGNYDLYSAIASASHNRCIERGFQQMLADKLRLAQHGIAGTSHGKGHALADRFSGTARILKKLVAAISSGDLLKTDEISRELNAYIRRQVMDTFEASLATTISVPPVPAQGSKAAPVNLQKVRRMLVEAAAHKKNPKTKLVVMKPAGKDSSVRLHK